MGIGTFGKGKLVLPSYLIGTVRTSKWSFIAMVHVFLGLCGTINDDSDVMNEKEQFNKEEEEISRIKRE